MPKQPCVYILASRRNGTLYIGVASNLLKRVWEHKNNIVAGFTQRYGVHTLVWFEFHETMTTAITREKTIKGWKRQWKLELIEQTNTEWRDLYPRSVLTGFRVSRCWPGMTMRPTANYRSIYLRCWPTLKKPCLGILRGFDFFEVGFDINV